MADALFENVYNPDVLSCLANLSNDEVFTPPDVANAMLDMLPQELFSDPDATFLDPACKTGVFLREIAKRLIVGLEDKIPDLQERLDHIFHKQLYGIAITELTSLLSRRSLYCSKYPNSNYSLTLFENVEGNIRYKRISHSWKNGKCLYCGAIQEKYDRNIDLETHAYEWIHVNKPEDILGMKFTTIISNPPYQLSDGGQAASAKSIYQLFIESAKKLAPNYIVMVVPARWYANGKGKGMDEFREAMLNDRRISNLVDYKNSEDCFPGVNIAGGVCYFLWDKNYNGPCSIVNATGSKDTKTSPIAERYLNEFPVLVRDNIAIQIIRKVFSKTNSFLSNQVKSYSYFAVRSYERGIDKKNKSDDVILLSSQGKGFFSKEKLIDKENILQKYKVIITYAMSGGNKPSSDGKYQIVSSLQILKPNEICTETYLVLGVFDDEDHANNLMSYVSTKFFRFLMLQALTSIHITKESFCFVPCIDLDCPISDKDLYQIYKLSSDEISFIESLMRSYNSEGGDNNDTDE